MRLRSLVVRVKTRYPLVLVPEPYGDGEPDIASVDHVGEALLLDRIEMRVPLMLVSEASCKTLRLTYHVYAQSKD